METLKIFIKDILNDIWKWIAERSVPIIILSTMVFVFTLPWLLTFLPFGIGAMARGWVYDSRGEFDPMLYLREMIVIGGVLVSVVLLIGLTWSMCAELKQRWNIAEAKAKGKK